MSNKKKKQAAPKPASASGSSRFRELKKRTRERLALLGEDPDKFRMTEAAQGEMNMSDVLFIVAAPYLKRYQEEDDVRRVFELAVMAWNASFMLQKTGEEPPEDWYESYFSPPLHPMDSMRVKVMLDEMMRRRQLLFLDIERLITKYQVDFTERGFKLDVASTSFSETQKDTALPGFPSSDGGH